MDDNEIEAVGNPEAQAIAQDLALRLGAHLKASLPARGQLVYRYVWEDGRSPTEIATLMNVERQVVYNWQHRVRDLVRAFLEANAVTTGA